MNKGMKEARLIVLSEEAHRAVGELVRLTGDVDSSRAFASSGAWSEIRVAFSAAEGSPGYEVPGERVQAPGAKAERILVLEDGETFSTLEGCRVYEVPAEWGTEEIEHALAGAGPP